MKISIDTMMKSKDSLAALDTLPLDADVNLELMYMEEDFEKRTKIAEKKIKQINEKYALLDDNEQMQYGPNGALLYLDFNAAMKEINDVVSVEFEVKGVNPIEKIPYELLKGMKFPKKILKDLAWYIELPKKPTPKPATPSKKPEKPKANKK